MFPMKGMHKKFKASYLPGDIKSGDKLDSALTKFFVRHGLANRVLDSQYFKEVLSAVRAAPNHPIINRHKYSEIYVPLETKKAKEEITTLFVKLMPVTSATISIDGATVHQEQLMNVVTKLADRYDPIMWILLVI
ncbi:hypothetical protein SARC_03621 [Sphaeroforma arctica JP610]|uniref:Uncharacterized protein n=1 Tax=Sphaeroforma arctica JP610 TaxID=667725 RepID=A0A0L0G563_9EUKA|nr:hypothetical protein SARC_03621 [Sphaeroforma arctica JP610]KNC84165.1 hypothetical protein SARC_03621 [Sphaeroforma arctica JP610]|eukprot:XP_014158067.1 hypothetical protein SARC_03621 [Sphaeroforma arctica JP610]